MLMRSLWKALTRKKATPNCEMPTNSESLSPACSEEGRRTVFTPLPHICAITDVGRVRAANEDAYCVSSDYTWFAVADGMGGHDAGEVAAALAIQTLVEFITPERMSAAAVTNTIGTLLLDAVTSAHECVLAANRSKEAGREMGCTLVVGSIANGLFTCHVGDVRCYVMHEGVLSQLTHDHSMVGSLVEAGVITSEQARVHPNKNQVLQAIGMSMGVTPDVNYSALFPNDLVLICSDGLWEAMPHEEIQGILAGESSIHQRTTQLVDHANNAGGHDNITAILCQIVPAIRS
jgi:PPM family protein phosphatase